MIDEEVEEPAEEGAPAWMATFSDLATLLLTFFVLLLSFANMDIQNFRTALGSVKEAFGVQFDRPGEFEGRATNPVELDDKASSASLTPTILDSNAAELDAVKQFVALKGMSSKVSVFATRKGIVLRLKDVVLFTAGSSEILDTGQSVLDMIAELYSTFEGELVIVGHTDDRPISTPRFPSNWELSAGRAASAMRYMAEERNAALERIRIAGYAHMQPIASNDDVDGRAQNRRVEFLFEYAQADAKGTKKARRMFTIPIAGDVMKR